MHYILLNIEQYTYIMHISIYTYKCIYIYDILTFICQQCEPHPTHLRKNN